MDGQTNGIAVASTALAKQRAVKIVSPETQHYVRSKVITD